MLTEVTEVRVGREQDNVGRLGRGSDGEATSGAGMRRAGAARLSGCGQNWAGGRRGGRAALGTM